MAATTPLVAAPVPVQSRQGTGHLLRAPPGADVPIELSAQALQGAQLTFKDLSFKATQPDGTRKVILEPCSGSFEPGQLVAVMGPSGCGKSTLVDMLAMKRPMSTYTGEVYVNGHLRDVNLFQRIASYVGQEDIMPAHWKVREALEFNTSLKRQPGSSKAARRAEGGLIDTLLEAFGLKVVADTFIGGPDVRGCSGGQRRRVTLARGVAAQASLLFADEPTSGLSATDAELCVKALRVIAKRLNVLVILVIHQPRREVAALFDQLVLLTSGPGRMAYFGPMAEASLYMEQNGYPIPSYVNATDVYLDLLTPGTETDASQALVDVFNKSQKMDARARVDAAIANKGKSIPQMLADAHEQAVTGSANAGGKKPKKAQLGPYAVPFCTQLRTLLARKLKITLRNPAALGMQLLMPIGMGFVLGAVFQGVGNHPFGIPQVEFVFILLTMLSLQSLPLMPLLIEERGFMRHETSERLYTEGAHILTTMLVTVPLSILGASGQTLIIYAMSGLPWKYLETIFFWTILLFFLFDALFQMVAAAAPDAQQAQTMATPFLVIFMLFNGVVVTRATAPSFLKWIFEISPTGYALQAIVTKMAADAGDTGKMVVASLGYTKDENFKGICIIAVMIVILRSAQVVALASSRRNLMKPRSEAKDSCMKMSGREQESQPLESGSSDSEGSNSA